MAFQLSQAQALHFACCLLRHEWVGELDDEAIGNPQASAFIAAMRALEPRLPAYEHDIGFEQKLRDKDFQSANDAKISEHRYRLGEFLIAVGVSLKTASKFDPSETK